MKQETGALDRRLPTASMLQVTRSLPSNAEPDWKPAQSTVPASIYIDPARYALEMDRLFLTLPIPIAPSVMVAAGSFVCREGFGKPLLLTRDRSGKAHVFLNTCRHRGSQLTDAQTPEHKALIVCPYHAWSYDLSGQLRAVPREETFESLDKGNLGLKELPSIEEGGLIWAKLGSEPTDDFSHVTTALIEELDAVGLSGMHLFAHRKHHVDGNWKLVMDTFLEGYHVTRLHAKTLGHLFEDAVVRVDQFGAHLRQTSGRLKFEPSIVPENPSISELRKIVTFVYTLMPYGVVICSPDYVNVLLMLPQGTDKTLVENFMLTDCEPATDKARERWNRSLALTDETTFLEDFAAANASHIGLKTGATNELILGGYEQAIKIYHEHVERLLHVQA